MWRRAYLLLVVVRLYIALSPSYLHPDENFQGPEPIAARIFKYPANLPWEFTTTKPIRSAFPLWLAYGIPMYILRELFEGWGVEAVPPAVVFYTLRVLMFTLSFVLVDGAVHDLVPSPRHRRLAVMLVASSYATWSWQCHTFSNAAETCIVLWSTVLVNRILDDKRNSGLLASSVLGFLLVLGVFTRITFPAFVLIPCARLVPHFRRKPFSLLFLVLTAMLTTMLAVFVDTAYYSSPEQPFRISSLWRSPTITPFNNLVYNSQTANLAQHGLHPYYQHVLVNLPQLLGPAFLLLLINPRLTTSLYSALVGIATLSVFPHQEARFLLPAIPLLLSSVRLPKNGIHQRTWISIWMVFNVLLGILMGIYHQAGVVPAQIWLSKQHRSPADNGTEHERTGITTFWWKTYPPPVWLLDGEAENHQTIDWMGMNRHAVLRQLQDAVGCPNGTRTSKSSRPDRHTYLAAPWSATFLDDLVEHSESSREKGVVLKEAWRTNRHVNMDDIDFEDDGVWGTVKRVLGRRGLVVWTVEPAC